jgi:High potential iron-sulfur protein
MITTRRTFIIRSVSGVGALSTLALAKTATAQTPEALSETDPTAVALGYKTDGSKVDKQKYPNYAPTQSCSGCALFQGKPTDASASCAAFGNKLVAGKGWCSAWTKKA